MHHASAMQNLARRLAGALLAGIALLMVQGCGGGGSSTTTTADPSNGAWIKIDSVAEPTVCNGATLGGSAFISPSWYHCCDGTNSGAQSGVTVTWRNETTGASGPATQTVSIVFGLLMQHQWTADVPLALGSNTIAVTAYDASGRSATQRTTATKTGLSFSVSGRIANPAGEGLGYFESRTAQSLGGSSGAPRGAVTSSQSLAGQYQFTCVPAGDYTLQASSTSGFPFVFSPAVRSFQVTNADVSGLDFTAPASVVAGRITYAANGAPSPSTGVQITAGAGSITQSTGSDGRYRFVVPDGAYRVAPFESLCASCTFTPDSQDIATGGSDLAGIDFTR